MIDNYTDRVSELYNRARNSTGEERDRRIYDLTVYIGANHYVDTNRAFSYHTVHNLTGSEDVTFHLRQLLDFVEGVRLNANVALLLDDETKFFQWVNTHQTKYSLRGQSSLGDILGALDEVRLNLIEKNLYSSNLELNFSKFVTQRFNLDLTDNRDHQLRLLAHFCTVKNEFTQQLLSLNQESLKKIALHFYNFPNFSYHISVDWFKKFLKLCENARVVEINVPIMTLKSDDLPPHVEELKLYNTGIDRLSLTLPKLKKIEKTPDFIQPFLFIELNAPLLTHVKINGSVNVLRLNTPYLEYLSTNATSLSSLILDTPFLSVIRILYDRTLSDLTLVHSERLRIVSFEGCESLRSILEPGRGLPNCRLLSLYECPAAIPQVPTTTEVHTGVRGDRREPVLSFHVNPKVLEENPLQVLLDFGKIFEKQSHFPNIVWINSLTEEVAPGMDAGGLRRHFVASLTEKLPPILEDKLALETFGRLIGFAAESSLLLGTRLPLEFFYELLSEAGPSEITKGVKASLGLKWQSWKRNLEETDANFTNRVNLFADQVQGKPVTTENLFPLLQFDGDNVETTKEYFRRFFSEFPLLVDERVFQLKHFHQMMWGSLSLEGRPITIHVNGPGDALPPIHVCSGEMGIPTYPDYQTFKNKLMWAFRAHDTFETI